MLKITNKVKYMLYVMYYLLSQYIYGFMLKQKILIIYVKEKKLIHMLTIIKKNELISAKSLLDIAVVDMLKNKHLNRFVLNYVL